MWKWFLAEALASQINHVFQSCVHMPLWEVVVLDTEKCRRDVSGLSFSWHSVLLLLYFQLWHLVLEIIWPRLQKVSVIKTSRCFWRVCGSWLSAQTIPSLSVLPSKLRAPRVWQLTEWVPRAVLFENILLLNWMIAWLTVNYSWFCDFF